MLFDQKHWSVKNLKQKNSVRGKYFSQHHLEHIKRQLSNLVQHLGLTILNILILTYRGILSCAQDQTKNVRESVAIFISTNLHIKMISKYSVHQFKGQLPSSRYSLSRSFIPLLALLRRSSAAFVISLTFCWMLFRLPELPRVSIFNCSSR